MAIMKAKNRVLNTFMLAMINVAAICSIKNWPVSAEYGFSSLFFLLAAALIFFIPVSLVAAELATGWPDRGGIFTWVKAAFGHRLGFLAIWFLWMTNIPWYPTILAFISSAVAFTFCPDLANNKFYALTTVLVLFWSATFLNLRGTKISGWISTLGAVLGTILPGALIIILGILFACQGGPLQFEMSWSTFFPDFSKLDNFVLLAGVLLSLAGIEMSAVHAREVKNPARDYPKAILLSAVLITILSSLGSLAIAAVIPQKEISLVSGGLDAFSHFFKVYGLHGLIPVMACLIAFGAFGQMSTWIAGPSKGLLSAAEDGDLPSFLSKMNAKEMPSSLLIFQAVIVSLMALVFLFMPSVSSSFWLLLVLTAQFYLLMYIMMFVSAIRLRYSKPNVFRSYKVPGGDIGMWCIASLGILSCLFAFLISFIPPPQLPTGNIFFYETFLTCGLGIGILAPFLVSKKSH